MKVSYNSSHGHYRRGTAPVSLDLRPWRRWQDWVNVLLGIWLLASPWVWQVPDLGLLPSALSAWTTWLLGVVIVGAALWALARPSFPLPEYINAAVGFGMCASLAVLGFPSVTGVPGWNQWVVGLLVFVLSGWAA